MIILDALCRDFRCVKKGSLMAHFGFVEGAKYTCVNNLLLNRSMGQLESLN